jgi:hypothetical protein
MQLTLLYANGDFVVAADMLFLLIPPNHHMDLCFTPLAK